MSKTIPSPLAQLELKVDMLLNDAFTPGKLVVLVLKAKFRMNEEQANHVMMTAHQHEVCMVAIFAQEVAETKATIVTDMGRKKGYSLQFTTKPGE